MKKYLYLLFAAFVAVGLSACSPDDNEPDGPETEIPDRRKIRMMAMNRKIRTIPTLRARH